MKNISYLLFLVLFPFVLQAKDEIDRRPYTIQVYDNRSGLSNSAINDLYQDREKLLWIATWDGLNLYDGSAFHVFNYNKDLNLKGIGNNVIQQITEDSLGNIWVATVEGVSRYRKESGRFYNYFYEQQTIGKISEREYQLAVDSSGRAFCLIQNKGLAYYDHIADTFRICLQIGRAHV